LTNLLDNALKFTEKGVIEFGYKKIDEESKLQFFVNDTGSGIPKEKYKILFERYRQVEDTTALRSSGSGLGLTICKSIIELLDGKIWLDPDWPEGASFNFSLPAFVEKPTDSGEPFDKPHEVFQLSNYIWKDKVIVVAEDDDVNYMFLETLLHETQAQVIRAINGLQVIELVKSINKIDMILMDIKMPEMNGYEASKKVKELNPKIPIIAQTAYSMKDDKTKTIEAGCDDYVAKPIVIETLLNKMNKYFQ
jgi:CheY-like chemotaxis protein